MMALVLSHTLDRTREVGMLPQCLVGEVPQQPLSGLRRHSSHAHTHTGHTQSDITKGNGNETNPNPSLCKDPHPHPKSASMQNGRDFSVIDCAEARMALQGA